MTTLVAEPQRRSHKKRKEAHMAPEQVVPEPEPEALPEPEPTRDNKLDALRVMAQLSDIPLNVKAFQSDWFLVTYDMPHTETGDKARR